MSYADMQGKLLSHASRASGAASRNPDWLRLLPAEWRDMVIEPFSLEQHREYEMAATRSFGYDIDGANCYYAHNYALNECRSDDDEEFYEVLAYGEAVHAWRLRDDRWLVYRVIHAAGDCATSRGFFSFAEQPPR